MPPLAGPPGSYEICPVCFWDDDLVQLRWPTYAGGANKRHRYAGLHFHDLRHTGNQFAANSGAGLRGLMARMGHDSERAAMIYQHEARGADKTITNAIDSHVEDERRREECSPASGHFVTSLPDGLTR
jgi:hypothetical protein